MSTLKALLDLLIDYAGLFPPAELAMRPAVENYQSYLRGPYRWILGRFIVPAKRLREFEAALGELQFRPSDERPWQVSALVAPASQWEQFQADVNEVDEFNARQQEHGKPCAIIDTVEGKAEDDVDIAAAAEHFTSEIALFLELPIDNRLSKLLRELEKASSVREVFAKVRTGGIVPEAIPPADRVAEFIASCSAHNIRFKATAGLHHPIRAKYPLTYRDSSPSAVMYGFLNVFVAACAAHDDHRGIARIEEILTESDHTQFQFGAEIIAWRGNSWSMDLVRSAREQAVSFGSCSFVEPVDDLRKLKLLS